MEGAGSSAVAVNVPNPHLPSGWHTAKAWLAGFCAGCGADMERDAENDEDIVFYTNGKARACSTRCARDVQNKLQSAEG